MKLVSYASSEFWSLYRALPVDVQARADKQFALFQQNPFHPSLRLKPVGQLWSARINRNVRALAYREGNIFNWFWIGPHTAYERLIGR